MIGVVGRFGWSAGLGGRAGGWSCGWAVELVGGRSGVGQPGGWSCGWVVGQMVGWAGGWWIVVWVCDGWI